VGSASVRVAARLVLALALAVACPGATHARSVSLDSAFRTGPITIDGTIGEWGDGLVVIKQANLTIGVRNDGDSLYICMQSRDPALVLQILDLGLTLWFVHPDGEKGLGVEYPLALDNVEALSRSEHSGGAGSGGAPPGALARLAIKGVGSVDRRILGASEAAGLSASAAGTRDDFVYELEIPLRASPEHPYAVEAGPGDTIEILLETPEPTPIMKQRAEGASAGGPAGGGMGGHGGGHHGGSGGGQGGYGGGQGGGSGGESGPHHGGSGGGQGAHGSQSNEEGQQNPGKPPAPLNLRLKIHLAAGDTTGGAGTSH
jgi:hypothetical protein